MTTEAKRCIAGMVMCKVDMGRDLIYQTLSSASYLEDDALVQCIQNIIADCSWLYEKLADIADPKESEE